MFNKKKFFTVLRLAPIVALLSFIFVVPAVQATPLTCNMSTVTGDDDGSFPMTLPFSLQLGNTEYNQIYYSTNGLMSFGQPDGNFWSYPQTPSVTLAGRDWVSFGPGAYTSYGYNENSFCIEWSVRPYPQRSGDLTQIRLVVNRFANGGWHGEITTLGWIPPDIRRGIVWEQNGTPLPIEAAFDVNGGVPVEVPPAPAPTSLTEPPAIPTQCWDGSTVYAPATCPAVPPDITCWNGDTLPWNGTCLPEPPPTQCWDGSSVTWRDICPPTPPDIICWNGEVVSWNGVCQQVPPPVECWNGTSVNWNEQCPVQPIIYPSDAISLTVDEGWELSYTPPIGMKISQILFASYGTPENYQYGSCHASGSQFIVENYLIENTSLVIGANNEIFGDPCGGTGKRLSIVITIEIDPTYVAPTPTASPEPQPSETQTPTLEPTPQPSEPSPQPSEPSVQPSETPSPSPTPYPSPSESQSQRPEPVVTPSPSPEQPSSTPSPEVLTPVESPSPDPSPSSTDLPYDNLTTEQAVEQVLSEYNSQEAVPFEVMQEAGLDYSDLPPDQPVMLENGVILTAEVADALQLFENPSEILSTVLTDPGKALKALASVGADMTPTQRKESEKVIIAAVIAGQLMNALGAANMIGRKL